MKQGTVSVLFGCHSIIHSILVTIAWKKIHKRWPKLWELFCIFVHDIGHFGVNYFDNPNCKRDHWILGAMIAYHVVGPKGYILVAGHTNNTRYAPSDLAMPDRYSWKIAPSIWLMWNCIVEPKLKHGYPILEQTKRFKEWVNKNLEKEFPEDNHQAFYALRRKDK